MKQLIVEALVNSQQSIATALYKNTAGIIEEQDEKNLRYFMRVIPGIIQRIERAGK